MNLAVQVRKFYQKLVQLALSESHLREYMRLKPVTFALQNELVRTSVVANIFADPCLIALCRCKTMKKYAQHLQVTFYCVIR